MSKQQVALLLALMSLVGCRTGRNYSTPDGPRYAGAPGHSRAADRGGAATLRVVWVSEPLTEDLLIAGDVTARLVASTTGRDADWAVKLIDVFPDSVPEAWELGGYQLMVAHEIMRGRYRKSFSKPEPLAPGTPLAFTVDLHQQSHTFRKGHRMMVQVQSTWFPIYDRNPQTWVPNIFQARAADFKAQTHRIWHTPRRASHVAVTVVP